MADPVDQGGPEDFYEGLDDLFTLEAVDTSSFHQRQWGGQPFMSTNFDYLSPLELEMQFVTGNKDEEYNVVSSALMTKVAKETRKEYSYKQDKLSKWKNGNWSDGFNEELKKENYELNYSIVILEIDMEIARKEKDFLQRTVIVLTEKIKKLESRSI